MQEPLLKAFSAVFFAHLIAQVFRNKVKLVGKGWCVQDHFSKKKTCTVTYCFFY